MRRSRCSSWHGGGSRSWYGASSRWCCSRRAFPRVGRAEGAGQWGCLGAAHGSFDRLDVPLIDKALLEETRRAVDLIGAADATTDHASSDEVDAILEVH
jgi:hypothetical protein